MWYTNRMRRVALIIGLFLFLFIAKNAHAECIPKTLSGASFSRCPNAAPVECDNDVFCCELQSECNITIDKALKICGFIEDADEKARCEDCLGDQNPGVYSAIGCIRFGNAASIVSSVFQLGIGIAGGIAFLLILFGGFQILVSAGNPERVQAGKELITSAITGLLLIIMSIFILRLIGFNILDLKNFG